MEKVSNIGSFELFIRDFYMKFIASKSMAFRMSDTEFGCRIYLHNNILINVYVYYVISNDIVN